MIEKIQHVLVLNDIYGPLLTDRQREVVALHYEEDWSLAEIAEHLAITKQAVHDLLKRTVASLETYEEKLGFAAREYQLKQRLDALLDRMQSYPAPASQRDELMTMIKQAGETL